MEMTSRMDIREGIRTEGGSGSSRCGSPVMNWSKIIQMNHGGFPQNAHHQSECLPNNEPIHINEGMNNNQAFPSINVIYEEDE